ncbi:MAG: hypothetical protein Q4D54_04280 [Eubacteriales bacterium]|nr:hypothetical protein [Eubacteriales bacterium]
MFELIPSQYISGIFEKLDFNPTDFNKATIIWNMYGKMYDEKLLALKELAECTTMLFSKIRFFNV